MSKSKDNTFDSEYWKRMVEEQECEWVTFNVQRISVSLRHTSATLTETLTLNCTSAFLLSLSDTSSSKHLECQISISSATQDRLHLLGKDSLFQHEVSSDDLNSIVSIRYQSTKDRIWQHIGYKISASIELEQSNYSKFKEISLNTRDLHVDLLLPFLEEDNPVLRMRREVSRLKEFSYRQRHADAFKLSGLYRDTKFD